ncbi:MAG TPA: sugar phosphate isomerase/epimerase [Candidatus Acidoferrum sp.]|nr:sugar phosphate isomerase/epimerase [Candidatus Acidoferrum sp.]
MPRGTNNLPDVSRREFLSRLAAAGVAASVFGIPACGSEQLYPRVDLTYFDTPLSPAPFELRIGYASITWGGNDRQAIEDISSLGYKGIQIRSNAVKEFGNGSAVRELLEQHHLKMVALSSGNLSTDPALESSELARHIANAKFLREAGGTYLQIIDEKPKGREIVAADYLRLGRLMTELGKRVADLGVQLGYHNHMGSMGQTPEGVEQIMAACDPRYARLELDIAHYFQGGGDPVKAISTYRDRLLFLHLKDVERFATPQPGGRSYRFVELGRGLVDVPAVIDALRKIDFRGWGIVELDAVPDKSRTPKDCALINKNYVVEKLGLSL